MRSARWLALVWAFVAFFAMVPIAAQELSDPVRTRTFKVEYKPAITKPVIDKMVASGSEIGQQIAACFEDKPSRPSFTHEERK